MKRFSTVVLVTLLFIGNSFWSNAQSFNLTYNSQFGTVGSGNGQLSGPSGVAVNSSGDVYVFDSYNSRIQVFTSAGVYKFQFGSSGSAAGQFALATVGNIAIDAQDNVYIPDV